MSYHLLSPHQISLFTNTFTLASAGVIDTQILDGKTEFLDTFPVASLESFPLHRGLNALADIACGLLTDNIGLDTSISTTNRQAAAR